MISFQNFKRQWEHIGPEVQKALNDVGRSGWYILGDSLLDFEKKLANKIGFSHCQGVGNGLDAIEISLRCLDLQKGDKVLTTPLSAFATTLAIVRAGGTPVFCDTDENGLIDLDLAQDLISKHSIKYFVPVHLYGQMLDAHKLNEIKKRNKVGIVEDSAQSIYGYNLIETKSTSDFITTSFYPTKNLGAMGDGGAILTNNKELYELAGYYKNYGQTDKYIHDYLGMNSRLDELQAAILSVHLNYLDQWHADRKNIALKYMSGIKNLNIKKLSSSMKHSTWHLFPVFLLNEKKRSQFVDYMSENNIQISIHYPIIIPQQKALAKMETVVFGELKKSKEISSTVVSLPLYSYLTSEEVDKIISVCNNWEG